jgi:hypothetical protein
MNNTNKTLAGLLLVQGLLIGATWWPRSSTGFEARELVALDKEAITAVRITGRTTADGKEVPETLELSNTDGVWTVASANGYPANPIKVDELLEKIATISVRSPVGQTEGSHRAFEVATDQFTRHLQITSAEGETDLYLGAGTGSSMNVRLASENEVYTTRGTTAWSIADAGSRYYDSEYVKVELDDITSFAIRTPAGSFEASRADGAWSATDLPEGMDIDGSKLDTLAKGLLKVRLAEPVGTTAEAAYGLEQGSRVEWTVSVDDETSAHGYTIGALAEDKHYVKADDAEFVVLVNESAVNKALNEFDFLVEAAPEEPLAE